VNRGQLDPRGDLAEHLSVAAVGFHSSGAHSEGSDECGRNDTHIEPELACGVGDVKCLGAGFENDPRRARALLEHPWQRERRDLAFVEDLGLVIADANLRVFRTEIDGNVGTQSPVPVLRFFSGWRTSWA